MRVPESAEGSALVNAGKLEMSFKSSRSDLSLGPTALFVSLYKHPPVEWAPRGKGAALGQHNECSRLLRGPQLLSRSEAGHF